VPPIEWKPNPASSQRARQFGRGVDRSRFIGDQLLDEPCADAVLPNPERVLELLDEEWLVVEPLCNPEVVELERVELEATGVPLGWSMTSIAFGLGLGRPSE